MVTLDQLKNLSERVSKLKIYLDIDKKLIEISNEEEKTADPDFWNNPKEAEILMKSIRFKKKWVDDYNKAISLDEDLHVLFEFYKRETKYSTNRSRAQGDQSFNEFITKNRCNYLSYL